MQTGIIKAVCTSPRKGTMKTNVDTVELVVNHGLKDDAHAGNWHRQVSLLSYDKVENFQATRPDFEIPHGAFGENILVSGLDFAQMPIGTVFKCGDVVMRLTQIGKECHDRCEIFARMGDCIMPREGVFAVVERGGTISVGDTITAQYFTAAVITASDKGAVGERVDESGKIIAETLAKSGYSVKSAVILPDDMDALKNEMIRLADLPVDLVLTTGGTGFSPRDITPEATLAVCDRGVPGIAEAIRAFSMNITPRAMLSRAASGLRKNTLIVNLPGSPKAVSETLEFLLPNLPHGLEIMKREAAECARQ